MHESTAYLRDTVGFSVFFRKLIKLSHNQMIEGCHPRHFQREIRFYWRGEWLSSTLTQGKKRCTSFVPGLHVLTSKKGACLVSLLWPGRLSAVFLSFTIEQDLLLGSRFLSKRPTDGNWFPTSGYYIFTFLCIRLLHISSSFHIHIFRRFIWFHTETHYE